MCLNFYQIISNKANILFIYLHFYSTLPTFKGQQGGCLDLLSNDVLTPSDLTSKLLAQTGIQCRSWQQLEERGLSCMQNPRQASPMPPSF